MADLPSIESRGFDIFFDSVDSAEHIIHSFPELGRSVQTNVIRANSPFNNSRAIRGSRTHDCAKRRGLEVNTTSTAVRAVSIVESKSGNLQSNQAALVHSPTHHSNERKELVERIDDLLANRFRVLVEEPMGQRVSGR